MRLLKFILVVAAFTLGAMYLPYPWNAILIGLWVWLMILGMIALALARAAAFSNRIWDALESRTTDDPDYIPYITTRYRRRK
jgi:hypothetical protein